MEAAVGAHEAIKDVAVIGVPDDKWGEAIKAVVFLHDGYAPSEQLAQHIMEFCKGRIAGYKRPKSIDFIKEEEMPRAGSGKILHRLVRQRYENGAMSNSYLLQGSQRGGRHSYRAPCVWRDLPTLSRQPHENDLVAPLRGLLFQSVLFIISLIMFFCC